MPKSPISKTSKEAEHANKYVDNLIERSSAGNHSSQPEIPPRKKSSKELTSPEKRASIKFVGDMIDKAKLDEPSEHEHKTQPASDPKKQQRKVIVYDSDDEKAKKGEVKPELKEGEEKFLKFVRQLDEKGEPSAVKRLAEAGNKSTKTLTRDQFYSFLEKAGAS